MRVVRSRDIKIMALYALLGGSQLLLPGCFELGQPDESSHPTPAEPAEESFTLCLEAVDYLQACGANVTLAFLESCHDAVADEVLNTACGELGDAVTVDVEHGESGSSTVVGSGPLPGMKGLPGWLLCSLGFNFACPQPACIPEVGIAPPSADEPCSEWLRFDGCALCEYYRCREARSQCGEDGYLLGYVGKYCDRFATVAEDKVSDAAGMWLEDVRECLVEELEDLTDDSTSCQEIEAVGIASHSTCYVQAGFCSLGLLDWFQIVHTIDPGDIPLQQVLVTGHACLKSWFGFL